MKQRKCAAADFPADAADVADVADVWMQIGQLQRPCPIPEGECDSLDRRTLTCSSGATVTGRFAAHEDEG